MTTSSDLEATIRSVVRNAKGILAADESHGTIAKRFDAIGVESTVETRRYWRSLLVCTPNLEDYISGVILFEETLGQQTDEKNLIPNVAMSRGIVPGIKVDKGKIPLALSSGDLITQGLDGLGMRLQSYKESGARFAKWREVYAIENDAPSANGIQANAEVLARYAAECQMHGLVPIVEPEVLMSGNHDIERHAEVTEAVLHAVYSALHRHGVCLELSLLKPNMVLPGKECRRATPEEVAEFTLRVLRRAVPAAVPGVHFLSGGQGAIEATENLNAICSNDSRSPWNLSISFGRALQQPALHAWKGLDANAKSAQDALLHRARMNSLAMNGDYSREDE